MEVDPIACLTKGGAATDDAVQDCAGRGASAATFATDVYTALASSETLDAAVEQARTNLHDSNDNEWANYIPYGNGAFRVRPAQQ